MMKCKTIKYITKTHESFQEPSDSSGDPLEVPDP